MMHHFLCLYELHSLICIQMESVIRHCFVLNPKEFSEASNDGDDVFYCEYEYDVRWHSFKRIADVNDDDADHEEEVGSSESCEEALQERSFSSTCEG